MTITRQLPNKMTVKRSELINIDPTDAPNGITWSRNNPKQVTLVWNDEPHEIHFVPEDDVLDRVEKLIDSGHHIKSISFDIHEPIAFIFVSRGTNPMYTYGEFSHDLNVYCEEEASSGVYVEEENLVEVLQEYLRNPEFSFRRVDVIRDATDNNAAILFISIKRLGTFMTFEEIEKDENSSLFERNFGGIYDFPNGLVFNDKVTTDRYSQRTLTSRLVRDSELGSFLRQVKNQDGQKVTDIDPLHGGYFRIVTETNRVSPGCFQ